LRIQKIDEFVHFFSIDEKKRIKKYPDKTMLQSAKPSLSTLFYRANAQQ